MHRDTCGGCKIKLTEENITKKLKNSRLCSTCATKAQKRWRAKWIANDPLHKDNICQKNYRLRIRQEVLNHYGVTCACCGEKTQEFLTVDHMNGGGGKHRKQIKGGTIYSWLKRNNYPEGFQILCFNCNQAKYIYGVCPHQQNKVAKAA